MSAIYLDNAATTPISDVVKQAMVNALDVFGNPSSTHSFGRKAKSLVESSRREIASALNCAPGEIIFTSGGTEADNLAILGACESQSVQHIITSPLEHSAVLESAEKAAKLFGVKVHFVKVNQLGEIDLVDLEALLEKNQKALVSLMLVNNELGNLLPIQKVVDLCQKYQALFHSDTVQGIGHIALDLTQLKVDYITCSAHKIHGPKGAGFLYARKGTPLIAQLNGGKQERSHRGGTENSVSISALGATIANYYDNWEKNNSHILELKLQFINALTQAIPGIGFNGLGNSIEKSVNTVVSVNFPISDPTNTLLFQLDLEGVMASGGSACSSGAIKGSHVISALEITKPTVRFSFSAFTTQQEVDEAIKRIVKVISNWK